MSLRAFARIFGVAFLLIGLSGFVPGLSPAHEHPGLTVDAGSALALGLFPVNVLHNLAHVAFGVWGLVASRGAGASRAYGKGVAIAYGLLTVMGLIPATDTTFGLVPIYGNDVWLHAVLAAIGGYFGSAHKEPAGAARR